MTLEEYISRAPRTERTALREAIATHCDVTEPAVRHWANGTRDVPVSQAVKIQNFTDGEVSISDLIPELRDAINPAAVA